MAFKKIIFALVFAAGLWVIKAEASTWPKTIKTEKGELVMYQPQPESLDGTTLSGRAAISVKIKDSDPVFGAVWITTTLLTDRDSRIASLTDIKIPNIKFADEVDDSTLEILKGIIEEEMPKWDLKVSMDEIITTLESVSGGSDDNFRNDPPEIIIANKPSILVFIDGEPILKDLEGFPYQRVENSPYFILFEKSKKTYYLYGEKLWFSSNTINSGWTNVKNPSANLLKIQEELDKADEAEDENEVATTKKGNIPEIVVRTKPAELIQIDGEPNFVPVKGTDLLYVKNSDDNIVLDIKSQNYFILISGRWYSSKKMNGPWSFLESEDLPENFSMIPEGSDLDVLLASVPGTNAAREAVLDTQIPQTAEIDRKTATVKVEYDGNPDFQKVDGTQMLYAVNSPQTVLKISNRYYCVDDGVWYEATNPNGPWSVATERPGEVEDIEPSSPVYNVKYVNIYEVTPTIVRVGYTPGYYGSYVYRHTVIYGTGYYYRPWYGTIYYPRPVTYGFRMVYNPWTGWGMRVGISYGGWFHMSFGGRYHGGYWGPPRYRPPHHWHGHHGGYYGNRPRPVQYNRRDRSNIYSGNRPGVKPAISQRPATKPGRTRDLNKATRENNVYTDKSGNVYQKTDKGWQTRENNTWKPTDKTRDKVRPATRPTAKPVTRPATQPATRPATRPTTKPTTGVNNKRPVNQSNFNRSALDKANQNRIRSQQRTNNFNRSVPAAKPNNSSSKNRR